MRRFLSSILATCFMLPACAGKPSAVSAGPPVPSAPAPSAPAPVARPAPVPTGTATLDERRRQLTALLDEQWQYVLRTSPVFASTLGDRRYNDR